MAKPKKKRRTPTQATPTKASGARTAKKKTPAGRVRPAGADRAKKQKARQSKVSGKKPRAVKRRPPAPAAKPKPPTAKPTKPKKLAPRSQHPEAIRSRKRRALEREARRAAEEKRKRRALERKQQARKRKKPTKRKRERRERRERDERELAADWLEMIRLRIAEVFPVELTITYPGGGAARPEDRDRESDAGPNPWMTVGRFDPGEGIDYQALAIALSLVESDLVIEAAVNPARLSQIRIMFDDPNSKRGEGGDVLSHIGAWTFVLGDAIGDLVGADAQDPTEGSLAARYSETMVPTFYIFFARTLVEHRTAWPGVRTQEVKLR